MAEAGAEESGEKAMEQETMRREVSAGAVMAETEAEEVVKRVAAESVTVPAEAAMGEAAVRVRLVAVTGQRQAGRPGYYICMHNAYTPTLHRV